MEAAGKALSSYREWVKSHATFVSSLEGTLQSAVWLLPDRFSDSELKAEALNAALGLLSLYHSSIIDDCGDQPAGKDTLLRIRAEANPRPSAVPSAFPCPLLKRTHVLLLCPLPSPAPCPRPSPFHLIICAPFKWILTGAAIPRALFPFSLPSCPSVSSPLPCSLGCAPRAPGRELPLSDASMHSPITHTQGGRRGLS